MEYELNRWQAFHPFASFEEVPPKYLKEDGKIDLQVISPRCFEAAALGTVMVMYPGEYSGLLKPGVHYISLEKDFSNFDDVIGKIKNHAYLEEISLNAHLDLVEKLNFPIKNSFIISMKKCLILLRQKMGTSWSGTHFCSK